MKIILLICIIFSITFSVLPVVLLTENFSGGALENIWNHLPSPYDDDLQAVPDSQSPNGSGPPDCNGYIGKLGDLDSTNTGIAAVYAGDSTWKNVEIEAWVYCYDSVINGASPQGGILARIDPTVSNEYCRFYSALSLIDPQLKLQTYTGSWSTIAWTGRTETAGWHKMKMIVYDDNVWTYFNTMNKPLPDCPKQMSALSSTLNEGAIGLGVLHNNATPPVAEYFDQIRVSEAKTTPPLSNVSITSFPDNIKSNKDFDITVNYTTNFTQTGHRGRIYLEVIDYSTGNIIKKIFNDNNGIGYNQSSASVTFTTSITPGYDSVFFRTYISPMEMNRWTVNKYLSYPRDGSYPYEWTGNGVTHDIYYKSSLILADNVEGNKCYCCGITYETFMDAYEAYNNKYGFDSIAGMSVNNVKTFRQLWYISLDTSGDYPKGCVKAIYDYNVGYEITNWEEALDGDFVQIWRRSGSGHSVIFRDWVRDTDGTITGIQYWSTQPSTNGINFNTENFGETSGVDATKTYIGRVVKPSDNDDWQNRYGDTDTSNTPTYVDRTMVVNWFLY